MKKLLTVFLSTAIILSSTAAGIPAACALEEVSAKAGYDYALSTDAISDADERELAKLEYNKYGFAYENFGNKIYENQVKSHSSCAVSGNMSDGYTAFNAKSGAAGVGWDGGWTISKVPGNSAAYINWILDYSTFWSSSPITDNCSCARFNGVYLSRKLLNPVDLSVDGDYFITLRAGVAKKVTDTVKDMGGVSLELKDASGNAPVVFGFNVPEGTKTYATSYLSGEGYDARTTGEVDVTFGQWYEFLVHIESRENEDDKLTFMIYPDSDPSAYEIITTEVNSSDILDTFQFSNPSNSYALIEYVGIDCFNDSITGSPFKPADVEEAIIESGSVDAASKVYKLLPETSAKTWYKTMYKTILDDTYNNIAVEETTEEDARDSFAFLGLFRNDYDWALKVDELKALCEQNGWDASESKIIDASHEDKSIVYEDTVTMVTLTYDYLLDESGSVELLQNGKPVEAECTVSENTVTLEVIGNVQKGITCVVSTENLTDYKGDKVPGIRFSLSMLPVLNIEDGGEYTEGSKIIWKEPEVGSCTVILTMDGEEGRNIESPYVISKAGEYTLEMIGEVEGGANEERTVRFNVNEAAKPEAKNVRISAVNNSKLKGDYDWYSANSNELEKGTEFIWYRSTDSSPNSKYEKVGNTKEYNITSDDENRWLIFAVIPGSDSPLEPEGEETKSKPYAAPFNPIVKSLGIKGELQKDVLLESEYEYYDENGDSEDKKKTVVKWYLADDDKNSEGIDITSKLGSDKKMKITEELFEKYLYITVQPVSTNAPNQGEIYTSERYLMPKAPVISDVKIKGNAKVGNTLTVDYKFFDANGDIEGDTVIEWKNVDTDKVLGTGRSLTLKSSMKGDIIHVAVKGMSQKAPYESLGVVVSDGLEVKAAESSSGGGGGKNISPSQSYSGSSSGSVVTNPSTDNTPQVPDVPSVKKGFTDIGGHWAEQNILNLEKAGIISSAELYRPDDCISRAELIALVVRSKGIATVPYLDSYSDITANEWYAAYIQTALNEGIISPAELFRPTDEISREEAAKILAITKGVSSDITADFADMDKVSPWAVTYVNAVYNAGIFTGDTNKCFNPRGQLTRAEAAAIIDRLIN